MRHFVVGQHDAAGQQWAQCVLETQNRLMAVAAADCDVELAELKLRKLEKRATRKSRIKAKKMRIELRGIALARLGTIRGIGHLLKIKHDLESQHGGRGWTRAELDAEQPEYWQRRLDRQALLDINATGRVGVGNQDALRMVGRPIDPPMEHVAAVERRCLEVGRNRILVAVPTMIDRETIKRDGLECLKGWEVPGTFERRVYVVQGKPVADAYNDAARKAIEDGADFLLCVEDDHRVSPGTFEKLWELHRTSGPRSIVGAWYPQKKEPRTGAAIAVRNGRREYLQDDGKIHEVYTVPQGFTLIPTAVFREMPQPWFATTNCITQDSFFSQLAREAGWKLYVDTALRIKHVCRDTGRTYE